MSLLKDATCMSVGICSIRMKMFDGHVRTLEDVRHVSDLRKKSSLAGSLGSSGMQVLKHGWSFKGY